MVDFDNVQSPSELTEEQKKAMELQRKMQKTVILSVTAGVLVTLGLGIVTILLLMHFGVISFNKNALKGGDNSTETSETTGDAANANSKLELVADVMSNYYFGDIDETAAQDSAYKAYVNSYGDKYSVYYTSEEYASLAKTWEGQTFYGIGVTFIMDEENGIKVTGFIDNSVAKKAGIKVGDHIVSVDGTSLLGLTSSEAIPYLRSASETTAHLTVKRSGETLTFDVKRQLVDQLSVTSSVLSDGKTGYVAVSTFNAKTPDQFRSELETLKKEGITRLIIDLRNNTGGVVSASVDVLDQILPAGTYGWMEYKDGSKTEFTGTDSEKLDIPYAVLVNGESASASEIFAGAVKDFAIGKVVGVTTYGKGISQRVVQFSDGSALKYTAALLYTPKGDAWNGKGITPDIVSAMSSSAKEDTQIAAALDYLNTQN